MYGQTGPLAGLPGYGLTLTGAAGISHLAGWPDRPPQPSGSYTDFVVPKFNVLAIVAALDYRRRTGRGQYLDASQLEATLHFQTSMLLDYTVNDREMGRIGNRAVHAAPHGVYRCQGEDNWCAIAVIGDRAWHHFCEVLDQKEWLVDARFATLPARLENVDELDSLIEERTIHRTAEEWMLLLQEAGVSAGVAQNGRRLDQDPQLKHRHYYWEMDHSEMGRVSYSGMPIRMSATPYKITRGAPRLGEHTAYVCTEILKMSDEEFIQLLSEEVLE